MDYEKLINCLERKTADTHELQAASAIIGLSQRVQELEERRCEVCGYAEHHREHTGCLRVKVKELTAERDKATQYWQIAEGRCDALMKQRDELVAALEPFVKHNSSKSVIDLAIRTSDIAKARAAIASVKEK